MKVVAVTNQKGGIGKTTTATTMAGLLQEKGYKVLFIDADPQRNSSAVYNAQIEGAATLYDCLVDSPKEPRINIMDAVQHTENGDIVASDKLMRDADVVFLQDSAGGIFRLKDALENIPEEAYDYIIIDTNPTIDRILLNVLVAADEAIIPTSASLFGVMGMGDLIETILGVKKRANPNLKVSGILVVAYDPRTRFDRDVKAQLEEIAKNIGTKIFKTPIRSTVRVRESQERRKLLHKYAPKCTSTQDYISFIEEFLEEE